MSAARDPAGSAASGGPAVAVDDAALLLGVSAASVRNWIEKGLLRAEDGPVTKITLASLRSARVLRDEQLLNLREVRDAELGPPDLAYAITDGALVPEDAPDRRWAIEDGARLVRWSRGEPSEVNEEIANEPEAVSSAFGISAAEAPKSVSDAPLAERGDGATLHDWPAPPTVAPRSSSENAGLVDAFNCYLSHGDPWLLPAAFFATEVCPEFIPPRDVGFFSNGKPWRDAAGAWWTPILRTAGPLSIQAAGLSSEWNWDRNEPFMQVPGFRAMGRPAREFGPQNITYELVRREWEAAWRWHRRVDGATASAPVGPEDECSGERDIVELLTRARREDWAPDAFPDWAFMILTPEDPWPRNDVFRFYFGAVRLDQYRRLWTDVIRSAGYVSRPGDDPVFAEATVVGFVEGSYPPGTPVERYGRENLAACLAERQWRREHEVRAARRRARGYAMGDG